MEENDLDEDVVPDQTFERHVRHSFIGDAHMATAAKAAIQEINTSNVNVTKKSSSSRVSSSSLTWKDSTPLPSQTKK